MTTAKPLELRQLGKTHMNVTAIGLGGAGLGGVFGPVGDSDGVAAVEKALELGMNYLDTAPGYDEAERRTGLALRGVPRDSYYISARWAPIRKSQVTTLQRRLDGRWPAV